MGNPLNLFRAGDWRLQLSAMNEEFLVSVSHHLALIRSLALVHTRPSLLPIEYFSEDFGLAVDLAFGSSRRAEKMPELDYLEEIKVVTRYPSVNQRVDHYRTFRREREK
ncbi:hypothetical protein JTE90_016073 [Oedothorax gibbosus]|uniref:Uncharacterized protein n=1 Tax=Oedothorax gibbosus TaxID=931172 RepID=A0AAV6TE47_9ARAC|nr:hypothetical protein JTE90_016073 [Oedothorax gibbosus]